MTRTNPVVEAVMMKKEVICCPLTVHGRDTLKSLTFLRPLSQQPARFICERGRSLRLNTRTSRLSIYYAGEVLFVRAG